MNDMTIKPADSRYMATAPQKLYASLLMDPDAPSEMAFLAERIGVDPSTIAGWHQSSLFRDWLGQALEREGEMRLASVWKEVYRLAVGEGVDAKTKLEAARMFAGRFDGKARVLAIGVQKVAQDFGKQLAKETARRLPKPRAVRPVQARVISVSPSAPRS